MRIRVWEVTVAAILVGCSSGDEPMPRGSSISVEKSDGGSAEVVAKEVEIVKGVPDRGRNPAVLAIDVGGEGLCTGTLISPKLVLTARHCVASTNRQIECPSRSVQVKETRDPESLLILYGDDVSSAEVVAKGRHVLAPDGLTLCDADIAVIELDRAITRAKPVAIRPHGVARGDRVRAVGFGRRGDGQAGTKLLRDHVEILSTSNAEFLVGEATCQGDSGGPAIDEDTGELVGVLSRGGPECTGPGVHNIYTRADAFDWLIEKGFASITADPAPEGSDAGAQKVSVPKRGTKRKPQSDVGGGCTVAEDCAAGVCVSSPDADYCSRPCGTGDRCPNGFHCKKTTAGDSVCVQAS